ncbi:tRNA lysidine(34) synthetase TilS [Desulfomicrobium salsuginis]
MRLQDLPRPMARRCLGLPRFCRDSLGVDIRGRSLVVAYSTGLDSTALLHILHLLSRPLGLTLAAAHAHHGLRPESDEELEHARATCSRLGIPLEAARLDVALSMRPGGPGLEECARNLRYAFLESVRAQCGADFMVTAHHADDLAEDILMRLVRGTGWPGLGGMTGADPARRLLRPLLDWEKCELQSLLETLGVPWREDRSNASADRTRNRIRSDVLPLLRRENPGLSKALRQVWTMARIDEDYWKERLADLPTKTGGLLVEARLLEVHPAQRLRLYKRVLDGLGPGQALAAHLLLLDRAWAGSKVGRLIQFPGDKVACVEKDGIRFSVRTRI